MSDIRIIELDCGAPLVVERMPGVKSAAISWLLPSGSVFEPVGKLGLGAMWEELLLRGAGDLASRAFADAMDRLGVNRSVSGQTYYTQIGASMIGQRLPEALPMLVDMVRRPRFDEGSIEPARELALQAIESLKDDPRQRAVLGARARHRPDPLNRSGMGTPETLSAITRDDLADEWKRLVRPVGSIIGVAGAVDADAVASQLNKLLAGWEGANEVPSFEAVGERGYAHETDNSNQVQIIICHDGPADRDEDSLAERVVLSVLSGGMSGRLFTEVREKRGLCYAVSAAYAPGREFGGVSAYVGTTPERAQEALDVLHEQLSAINGPGGAKIDQSEFERALVGLRSRIVFSGESTRARAASIAGDMHSLGRPRPLRELSEALDALTLDGVNSYLERREPGEITIQTLGPETLTPPKG